MSAETCGAKENAPAPVQLDYLKEYAGDDTDFLIKITRAFLEENEKHLENLVAAVENKDVSMTSFHAHALKNGAETFKAKALADIARRLEALAQQGVMDEAPDLLPPLHDAYAEVVHYLTLYVRETGGETAQLDR